MGPTATKWVYRIWCSKQSLNGGKEFLIWTTEKANKAAKYFANCVKVETIPGCGRNRTYRFEYVQVPQDTPCNK